MPDTGEKDTGKQEDVSVGDGSAAGDSGGVAAPTKPQTRKKSSPQKSPPQMLPPWKVLLHNDDKNDMVFVIRTICELTPLNREDAMHRMLEAHKSGVALLLLTHKERAELYKDQFESKGLTCSIEPEK
jgi:ATP-dependent Clp protease adaptor protein ClpS